MIVELTQAEIELIATAIEVAQFESLLPDVKDDDWGDCPRNLMLLLDKLGIKYDDKGHVIHS